MTLSHTLTQSLRLGGLTPMTTKDYPGELAATLFCQGCPWRCAYCHNAHLVANEGEAALDWSDAVEFLTKRQGLLDAVVFSGGEPTAQAALPSAMAEVRELGFKIGLHTGGPYPKRLAEVLSLVDWVGLDIKALPADYPVITGVPDSGEVAWESLSLLLDSDIKLEIRTTPMPGLDSRAYLERLMQALAAVGAGSYVLQQCRPHALLDPKLQSRLPSDFCLPDVIPFKHFAIRRD